MSDLIETLIMERDLARETLHEFRTTHRHPERTPLQPGDTEPSANAVVIDMYNRAWQRSNGTGGWEPCWPTGTKLSWTALCELRPILVHCGCPPSEET